MKIKISDLFNWIAEKIQGLCPKLYETVRHHQPNQRTFSKFLSKSLSLSGSCNYICRPERWPVIHFCSLKLRECKNTGIILVEIKFSYRTQSRGERLLKPLQLEISLRNIRIFSSLLQPSFQYHYIYLKYFRSPVKFCSRHGEDLETQFPIMQFL